MKMKGLVAVAAIALTGLTTPAWSQGSMMRGGGHGMGHSMMMGGSYDAGPGMMHGGYGMGPGMMGGGCAMGGWGGRRNMGAFGGLDLSAEQRTQLRTIRRDLMHKHWQFMEQMQTQADAFDDADQFDEKAERRAFDAVAAARKTMFEARLDAQKRMLAVLTADQRAKLRAATVR